VIIALRSGESIGQRAKRALIAGSIVVLCTGWYFPLRFSAENKVGLAGNVHAMNKRLGITRSWTDYFQFHPVRIVEVVHNDPWRKGPERQFFWEYFYRSAFTGEFNYGSHMFWWIRLLYAWGLLGIPFLLYGIIESIHRRERIGIPFAAVSLCLLGGQIAYSWIYQFSPNQDFRFSNLIVIPIGYFLIRGIQALPERFRMIGWFWFSPFLVLCLVFLLHMVFPLGGK
jgi:hypothetical protein